MAADEDFLRRWSRRKRGAAAAASAPKPPAGPLEPPQELPSLDSLSFESDFKAFMHAKVEDAVKRAALKKLFSDPRFNVMDGLDVYIDDYSKGEVLAPELVATLEHAKRTLLGGQEEKPPAPAAQPEAGEAEAKREGEDDGPARQDA